MPLSKNIFVATKSRDFENALRKLLLRMEYRGRWVHTLSEGGHAISTQTFLLAFFDRLFYKDLISDKEFLVPTYKVMVVDPKDVGYAITLQAKGEIQDWLSVPLDAAQSVSVFSRAELFKKQALELYAVKSAAAKTIRQDATMLCSGKWSESVERWIEDVALNAEPLLIMGEPGCGKRLLGKLIHIRSEQASGPFVTVRCQNKDAVDLEREIFGEVPKNDRPNGPYSLRSKFSMAANGTIFFDKIECMPKRLQQRIVRVLDSQHFSPLGAKDPIEFQARFIFSIQTRSDEVPLAESIHPDLLRKLKRHMLQIPPLRNRKQDLSLIVENILEKLKRSQGTRVGGITDGAVDYLSNQKWPGNIREMEGVLWAASLVAGKGSITPNHLKMFLNSEKAERRATQPLESMVKQTLGGFFHQFDAKELDNLHAVFTEQLEKELFKQVLDRVKGSQVQASKILGINRNTLKRKIDHYQL